jgi:predicted  nucleic acid-binding Zn-ribbon protein
MDELAPLEARLQAALERIAEAASRLQRPDPEAEAKDAEIVLLQNRIAAEEGAKAELAERVAAIREKQDQTVAQLETRVLRLQERVRQQADEIGRLRYANGGLRTNLRAMRQAAAKGGIGSAEIGAAIEAELEATRAVQAADRAELDAILAELTPLIEERADV